MKICKNLEYAFSWHLVSLETNLVCIFQNESGEIFLNFDLLREKMNENIFLRKFKLKTLFYICLFYIFRAV